MAFGVLLARIRFGGPGWSAPVCMSPDVVNAATLSSDGVAPGEFVSLTGFGIGPENPVVYQPVDQPGPPGQTPLALGGAGHLCTVAAGERHGSVRSRRDYHSGQPGI
ncbi:MAG TPA: hypothetical protein VNY05_20615 [Candidatus Acidoferrales bacterium]|nr:hypothetical protein [Candidatus Acidoferrales bacterium]